MDNLILNQYILIDLTTTRYPHFRCEFTPDFLDEVSTGDFVKIGLEHPKQGGERFWAVVVERGPKLTVRVDNELHGDHGIRFGDILFVGLDNIIDFMYRDGRR
jgi:hypothetical protein